MAALSNRYGLNKTLYTQYFRWIKGIVTKLDFGQSFRYDRPVMSVLGERIPRTVGISTRKPVINMDYRRAVRNFLSIKAIFNLGLLTFFSQYHRANCTRLSLGVNIVIFGLPDNRLFYNRAIF